jgi:hypothetical protein
MHGLVTQTIDSRRQGDQWQLLGDHGDQLTR